MPDRPRRGPDAQGARPTHRGKRANRSEHKAKAEAIAAETGIPRNLAFQVAMGNITLNEVLVRMQRKDQVETLVARHEIVRSLATQVVLGQADLDDVLRKKRHQEHRKQWGGHSLLDAQEPIWLAVHGRSELRGTVVENGPYEVKIETSSGVETVHKLQLKLGCVASDASKVSKRVKRDPERDAVAEPVWRPQDRYGCSDKRLFGYLDNATRVRAVTLEGDAVTGELRWMSRWEFGLELKGRAMVTVFRHALADVSEA